MGPFPLVIIIATLDNFFSLKEYIKTSMLTEGFWTLVLVKSVFFNRYLKTILTIKVILKLLYIKKSQFFIYTFPYIYQIFIGHLSLVRHCINSLAISNMNFSSALTSSS